PDVDDPDLACSRMLNILSSRPAPQKRRGRGVDSPAPSPLPSRALPPPRARVPPRIRPDTRAEPGNFPALDRHPAWHGPPSGRYPRVNAQTLAGYGPTQMTRVALSFSSCPRLVLLCHLQLLFGPFKPWSKPKGFRQVRNGAVVLALHAVRLAPCVVGPGVLGV